MRVMICGACECVGPQNETMLAERLEQSFGAKGVETDRFLLPYAADPLGMPEQLFTYGALDVGARPDMLVSVGFPSFFVPHRRKYIFLYSLTPELGEYWNTPYGALERPQYAQIRKTVNDAVARALGGADGVFCASGLLCEDLKERYGINAERFNPYPDEKHVALGRKEPAGVVAAQTYLCPEDRVELMLDMLGQLPDDMRLRLFIPAADSLSRQALDTRVGKMGLRGRVEILERGMGADDMAGASVLLDIPFGIRHCDQLHGLAARTNTPLVTAEDCGALLELAGGGVNGVVAKPEAEDIAQNIRRIAEGGAALEFDARRALGGKDIKELTERMVAECGSL